MPLALTCDCGARFEVDETLAGQEVNCPECLQALKAPTRSAPPRTSGAALASVVLALVGAFTVIGTLAAVAVGVFALMRIGRQRDRLCGAGYAIGGIVAGCVLTVLTVAALWRSDLVPVSGWVRRRTTAGELDTAGALEVLSADGSCMLTRTSEQWGRARGDVSDDPAVSDLQKNPDLPLTLDLLLVHPGRHAYVDVHRLAKPDPGSLAQQKEAIQNELEVPRPPLLSDEDNPGEEAKPRVDRILWSKDLDSVDGHEGKEWGMMLRRGGQQWTFVVRAYRKQKPDPRGIDPVHVIRGYCLKRHFPANEAELRRVMDSVRFTR